MLLTLFPTSINSKFIQQIVECLEKDGVVIIPTDTVYAFACSLQSRKAFERICRLKGVKPEKANFSLLCYDLSHISDFTKPFDTAIFRLMKNSLPGPFTFILNANNSVPEIFRSNKKTIGIRVPDNTIARTIVHELGHPLIVTSVHDEDHTIDYTTDPDMIDEKFANDVDITIDGGPGEFTPSTIIDCTGSEPVVIREGKGRVEEV